MLSEERYIHLSDIMQTKRVESAEREFRESQCRDEVTETGSWYATAELNSSTLVCD